MAARRGEVREMAVAVYVIVELSVQAVGETDAILQAAPGVKELENQLNKLGYEVEIDQVRVRRPSGSEKAKEREQKRKAQEG